MTDFGAVPNSGADTRTNIQQAIDAAAAAGGGWVVFPNGRYDVTIPTASSGIVLRAGVGLRAASRHGATIRVAAGHTTYVAVFEAPPTSPADDVAVVGLVFDQNTAGNPWKTSGNGTRNFFKFLTGHRILFERNRFVDLQNVQTLLMSPRYAYQTVEDFTVRHNEFVDVGGSATDFDHSTIYTVGLRYAIHHNSFATRGGAAANGAHTAIETHGGDQWVAHNRVHGFNKAVNITGTAVNAADRQLIEHNTVTGVAMGFYLWSYPYQAFTGGLGHIWIQHNTVTIDADAYATSPLKSIVVLSGVALQWQSTAPIEGLRINHNKFNFTNTTVARQSWDLTATSGGITLYTWTSRTPSHVTDLDIQHNTIVDSPGAGIAVMVPVNGTRISHNVLTNVASSLRNGSVSEDPNRPFAGARYGIHVSASYVGTTENLTISKNTITGNAALDVGVHTSSTAVGVCSLQSNVVAPSSVKPYVLGPGWVVT